jgi:hypothetical protein
MYREEVFQKLTILFAEKINYDGEFNTLFIIEKDKPNNKFIIKFLNQQHYELILTHLKEDILSITGNDMKFSYLSMKTDDISLKSQIKVERKQIIKLVLVKPKEKAELPTIKNRTINQIEQFMFDEFARLCDEQKEILKKHSNPIEERNVIYFANAGEINMITKLWLYFKKIKDYDE